MSRDALVVGINTYQWLPGLNAPGTDAAAIAQRLQSVGEFRVVRMPEVIQAGQPTVGVKTPVTLAELEAALVRLFKPKGNNVPQTALFYFSGHGLQKDAGIREGYLATSDANPNAGFYGLSLFWLRRLLQESPVRQRIILLDCCHSGELLNYLEADPGAHAGTDRLFMAASREYEAAYESLTGQYSVFTQALLEGLDPNRLPTGLVTNYALTDWVSNALKGEMQQPLFENSGSEIVLTRNQGCPTPIKTELQPEICPYRGLECFDEAHAEYFFGREDLTDQLLEKLKTRNFVAVVGASGSGKSSLVRAGLIHQLRQGQKFSGSDRWRIQLITPTDQPLKSLAAAFVNSKAPTVDRAEHLRRAETLLRDGGNGLAHLVRASLISSKYGRNSRLLLIIDQFEEVFTLGQGPNAERDRHRFFNSLLTALREAQDCLSIVIVLRADFFAKCSLYNGLAEQIEQNLVTVTPLTYEQIKSSVVKPAQKAGLICDPNLVYNILLDVVGAPGELPLLQYALLELWQQRLPDPNGGPSRLTLDAYTALGGVRGTLQKRANEIFYSLAPDEQAIARRIFIALTQLGDGTEDTRRRILKSELISPRFPAELVERVLEKLVTAKLVVTNRITPHHQVQEREQGFANVSTALRLAQMRQGKFPHHLPAPDMGSQELAAKQQTASLNTGCLNTGYPNEDHHLINRITHRSTAQLAGPKPSPGAAAAHQETIDVAHETLIRNWDLLRSWLDDNREMLRRQRRLEHTAREWQNANQPKSPEYLLHGERLVDATDFLKSYPHELSALAQHFIALSQEESNRTQKELRLLQLVVPGTLVVALGVTFNQYYAAMSSQAEKDHQLQIATSRQQAAIAQTILQEPDGDPTTALLISRLAAENGGRTYEAQASLRAALQKLQLQTDLVGHTGAVNQLAFSPNREQLATAGVDGTIRIWSLKTYTLQHLWQWQPTQSAPPTANAPGTATPAITTIAFNHDGSQLAAIAANTPLIQIWSMVSGVQQFQLRGSGRTVTGLAFSPNGHWIATASANHTVQIWRASNGQLYRQVPVKANIRSMSFSPNSQSLMVASGSIVALWQVSSKQPTQILRHPTPVVAAGFSPSGHVVVTRGRDGRVRVWHTKTGRLRYSLPSQTQQLHPTLLQPVLFSPDGQLFVTPDQRHGIRLWRTGSGEPALTLARSEQNTTLAGSMMAFSPNGQVIAIHAPSRDRRSPSSIEIWHTHTGQLLNTLQGQPGLIQAMQFSPDGTLLATASSNGTTRLWSAEMGSELPSFKLPKEQIRWVAFQGDGNGSTGIDNGAIARATSTLNQPTPVDMSGAERIMTVAIDGTLQNWHIPQQIEQSTNPVPVKPGQMPLVDQTAMAVSNPSMGNNFLTLLTDTMGAFVKRLQPPVQPAPVGNWQRLAAAIPKPLGEVSNTSAPAAAIRANPTNAKMPLPQGSLPQHLPIATHLTSVAFSPATRSIAIATDFGELEIWQEEPDGNFTRRQQLEKPAAPTDAVMFTTGAGIKIVRHLAFNATGQTLVGVSQATIYLWDVASGKIMQQLQGHTGNVEQANFSPNGQWLVSASRDRTVRIWEVTSGKLIHTLSHREPVSSARFSPNGNLLVTASWDGTARILDARTGELQVILTGHQGAVLGAEFSPDGHTLVTASVDGTARLWDATTGTEQATLRPLQDTDDPFQQAFFSPTGRHVATLSRSGQLYVWVTTWDGLLALARDRSHRQLQPDECLRYLRLPPNACPTLATAEKS